MDVLNLDNYTDNEINYILDQAQAFKDGKQVNYEGKR